MLVGTARPAPPERLDHPRVRRPRCLLLAQMTHPARHPYRALVRPYFTGEQLQQRRLAGAVGPGDEKAAPAAEDEGTHAQAVTHAYTRQPYGGQLRGSGPGVRRDVFRRPHTRREGERIGRRRHRVAGQSLDPLARVADAGHRSVCAASGPEAAVAEVGQGRLARDGVEPGGVADGQVLVASQFGAPLLVLLEPSAALRRLRRTVARVPVAVAGDVPRLGLQHRGGQALQEDTVVGDREHRAGVRPQLRLQPFHGVVVQVVGRLVQEQGLRAAGEDAGQRQTGAFASGEGAEPALTAKRRQAEVVQRDVHAAVGVVAAPCLVAREQHGVRRECRRVLALAERLLGPAQFGLQGPQVREGQVDGVLDGGRRGQREGLRQVADSAGGGHRRLTAVGALPACEDPEEGGFAGAVVTDQSGLLTRFQGEGDLVQNGAARVALGDVAEGEL